MLRSEGRFQAMVKRDLELAGSLVFNVHGGGMQSSGWPDLMVFHGDMVGGYAALELKMKKGSIRTNQIARLRDMRRRQVRAFVLRYWEDGDLTFEVPGSIGSKLLHVLTLQGWYDAAHGSSEVQRRQRGHTLITAIEQAYQRIDVILSV